VREAVTSADLDKDGLWEGDDDSDDVEDAAPESVDE